MEAGRVVRRFTLAGAYYHSRLSGKLIFECHIYKSNVRSVFFVTLKLGKQIQREEVVSMGLRVKRIHRIIWEQRATNVEIVWRARNH